MEEDDSGMRAGAGGDVDKGVEEGSVAGELEGLHCGGVLLVGGWVRGDGRLRVEGDGGQQEGGGEEEFLDAHAVIVGEIGHHFEISQRLSRLRQRYARMHTCINFGFAVWLPQPFCVRWLVGRKCLGYLKFKASGWMLMLL